MGLSNLGIFHTVVGIIAIIAALASYLKYGRINLAGKSGTTYFYGTVITSLTALGLSKHGGFNPGHILSLLVLVLVIGAFFLHKRKAESNRARYFENFFLSFSFFSLYDPYGKRNPYPCAGWCTPGKRPHRSVDR